MARITHPNPTAGLTTAASDPGGVIFRDGVADVDLSGKPILESFYVLHGYSIDYDIDEIAQGASVNVPLSALTIAELRQVARDNNVYIPKGLRLKEEIVEHVESTLANRHLTEQGIAAPGDVETPSTDDEHAVIEALGVPIPALDEAPDADASDA